MSTFLWTLLGLLGVCGIWAVLVALGAAKLRRFYDERNDQ